MIDPNAPAPEPAYIDPIEALLSAILDNGRKAGDSVTRMRVQRQMPVSNMLPSIVIDDNMQRDELLLVNKSAATIYIQFGEDATTYSYPLAAGEARTTSCNQSVSALGSTTGQSLWVLETSR